MACRARGLAGHRLRARRRFFERLLGLGVGFRVLRAHRQPAKSERGQLLAHGPLVHRDAEAFLDPALQVDVPPAHHPVRGGVGTLAHHAREFRPPSRARSRRGPGRAAVRQPLQPFGVVAVNPVRSVCRSMPQLSAAVLRSTPSSTNASASMRRAALASFAFAAEARSSRAEKSVRVIATAIETSMLRWKRLTAANRRESPASHRPEPSVSGARPAQTLKAATLSALCFWRAASRISADFPAISRSMS